MKIDFKQVMMSVFNKPLTDEEIDESGVVKKKDLTLGAVAMSALLARLDGDDKLSGEKKAQRHSLAHQIVNASEPLELKVEDVALIKDLIGKGFGPNVVGPAWAALEKKDA